MIKFKNIKIKYWIPAFAGMTMLAFAHNPKTDFNWSALETLAVQSRGRVKPFDTLARETVQFITGKTNFQKFHPIDLLFSWMNDPNYWREYNLILINNHDFKKMLDLEIRKKYFSVKELLSHTKLISFLEDVHGKRENKQKMNSLEEEGEKVFDRISLFQGIAEGSVIALLPSASNQDAPWLTLSQLQQETGPQIQNILLLFSKMLAAHAESDFKSFEKNTLALKEGIRKMDPSLRWDDRGTRPRMTEEMMTREVHYNHLHPFQKAWILYVLSFFLLLLSLTLTKGSKIAYVGGLFTCGVAFLIHAYGFILRCFIAGRPPVTNMYESIIWVAWGSILFGLILELIYRKKIILLASTVFAVIALILADQLPAILDSGIHPLVPVLRDNFWLTIHVLTITSSYAAFAVAFVVGNITLGLYIFSKNSPHIQEQTKFVYKAVQIGVLLLAAGTILGGVWADYAWGRFWGWDPKEVWALIALLFYLATLHGRFSGWLKDFGFVVASTLSFLGVLMAWYGVNFILGVGLHSYGFGAGGLGYVASFVGLQLLYILVAVYKQHSKISLAN